MMPFVYLILNISFSNYINIILKASASLWLWLAKYFWSSALFSCLGTLSEAPLRAVGFSEFWEGRMKPLICVLMRKISFWFQLNWAIIPGEGNPSILQKRCQFLGINMHACLLKSKPLSKGRSIKPQQSFSDSALIFVPK